MSDNENETYDLARAELISSMRTQFEHLMEMLLGDAKGEVNAYLQVIGQEFARYLRRSTTDELAWDNLRDLKAQVMLLGAKREVIATRETWETVSETAGALALFAARVLVQVVGRL